MPISQSQLSNWSRELIELANRLDIRTIEELRKVAYRHLDDPFNDFEGRISGFTDSETDKFISDAEKWMFATLSGAYLTGITMEDRELNRMLSSPKNEGNPLPNNIFDRTRQGTASEVARQALKDFPNHIQNYAGYENAFREAIDQIKLPYQRSSVQAYRNIAAIVQSPTYINGDRATRINLSQNILRDLSGRGIETIAFPSGRRMTIEAWSEREARAYNHHVAVQGQINRATERGYELVQISAHAGASPMCYPYQGKVFSLTGDSDQYPPLQNAIFTGTWDEGGGIYHDYCSHFQSTYIPGVSEGIDSITDSPEENKILNRMGEKRGNDFIFKQEQEQRRIERQIRMYKRREAGSLTKSERERNNSLVRRWQSRQRELIDENPFLKRQYHRESV